MTFYQFAAIMHVLFLICYYCSPAKPLAALILAFIWAALSVISLILGGKVSND